MGDDDFLPTMLGDSTPGGEAAPALRLRHESGSRAGQLDDLTADSYVLGRGEGRDIPFDDTDGMVSGRHARIFRQGASWWIEDLGSTNGTRVNEVPLTAPVRLGAGDRVELGARDLEGSVTLLAELEGIPRVPRHPEAGSSPEPRAEEKTGALNLLARVKRKVRSHVEKRELRRELRSLEEQILARQTQADEAALRLGRALWEGASSACSELGAAAKLDQVDQEMAEARNRVAAIESARDVAAAELERWMVEWKQRSEPLEVAHARAQEARTSGAERRASAEGALKETLASSLDEMEGLSGRLQSFATSSRDQPSEDAEGTLAALAAELNHLGQTLEAGIPGLPEALEERRQAIAADEAANANLDAARMALESAEKEKVSWEEAAASERAAREKELRAAETQVSQIDRGAHQLFVQLGREALEQSLAAAVDLAEYPSAQQAVGSLVDLQGEIGALRTRLEEP